MKSESRMWQSGDVPGMVLILEATTTCPVATARMKLVEVKQP